MPWINARGVRPSKSNIFLVWTLHLAIILTWYHANDRFIESLMPGSGAMSYLQGINRITYEFNKEPWHLIPYSHTSDRVPSQESLCRPPSSAGSPAPRLRPLSKEMRTASTSRSLHLTSNRENCCRYWLYFLILMKLTDNILTAGDRVYSRRRLHSRLVHHLRPSPSPGNGWESEQFWPLIG